MSIEWIEKFLELAILLFFGSTMAFGAYWFYLKWCGVREWWAELARPKQQPGGYNRVGKVGSSKATSIARSQQLHRQQPKQWTAEEEAAYRAFLEEME